VSAAALVTVIVYDVELALFPAVTIVVMTKDAPSFTVCGAEVEAETTVAPPTVMDATDSAHVGVNAIDDALFTMLSEYEVILAENVGTRTPVLTSRAASEDPDMSEAGRQTVMMYVVDIVVSWAVTAIVITVFPPVIND
jgi:hypothetical protein